jgi:osmotically-inducible protein OsmY
MQMRTIRTALMTATFAAALCVLSQGSWAETQPNATAQTQENSSATSNAAARLNKKQYRDVKVNVDNSIATLTGTVDIYQDKADAEKRVRKAKGVRAVRNLIEVAGPSIPDQELQAQLQNKLIYDRVFYGNAFNSITVSVENGVVILGGHARTDMDKDSALTLIFNYPGVKNVTGVIEVDPVSTMDDQIRLAVFHAVYGFPTLNKYAIDPAKPIRISVQNGRVELYGMVDTQADKNVAFIRANGVPGIFSVTNYLLVANPSHEVKK